MVAGGIAEQHQRTRHEHGTRPLQTGTVSQTDQYDAGRQCQGGGHGMNPAAHRRFGPTVHVKANLPFDFRRSDAFYFCGTSFTLGNGHFRLAIGLLANVLGLVACLHANYIGLGLKRLFARFCDDRAFFLDLSVCGFRHLRASTVSYGTVTYVTVTHGYVNSSSQ